MSDFSTIPLHTSTIRAQSISDCLPASLSSLKKASPLFCHSTRHLDQVPNNRSSWAVVNNSERSPSRVGVAFNAQTSEEVVESPMVWFGGEAKYGGSAWKRHVSRFGARGVRGDFIDVSTRMFH